MNKNSISLILLCLIKNCLWGGIEYYNIPSKINVGQRQIEALEAELFPKEVRDIYNNFTNPFKNSKAKSIKNRATKEPEKLATFCTYYNNYIFTKLTSTIQDKELKNWIQDKDIANTIKTYLSPYSSFYFCKLLGCPIENCEKTCKTSLENIKKIDNLIVAAPVFLNHLKIFKELNVVRYALSNLLGEKTSHPITFERPDQQMFAMWEIYIASILKTLKGVDNNIYEDFMCNYYLRNSQKGLLLNWENFWNNYQDQAKALKLKKNIQTNVKNFKQSFYDNMKTMPIFDNCYNYQSLPELFAHVFNQLKQIILVKKYNLIDEILNTLIFSNTFSVIDGLFTRGMLHYSAKVYLVHKIEPIYPNDILNISRCIVLAAIKQSILSSIEEENQFVKLAITKNAFEETEHDAQKLREAFEKIQQKREEAQKEKDELDQLLAEKKEQAEKYKQQAKEKEQKTLDELDALFGADKSKEKPASFFQKTIITEDEYKALLEQACSTGDVMQHGSHATMRMTLEDEKGEARQVQVQGYKKHGSALKKGGKGKKSYAVLEQKEKKDPK